MNRIIGTQKFIDCIKSILVIVFIVITVIYLFCLKHQSVHKPRTLSISAPFVFKRLNTVDFVQSVSAVETQMQWRNWAQDLN